MKKLLLGITAAVSLVAVAAPALAAGNICLSTRDMRQSSPRDDGGAITFYMRDGSVWRNDLIGRCPDLKFNGYVWTVRNPDGTVCENEQTFRVLQSGEVCKLGKFTQITPSRAQMDKHAER
jgi:hypothetical protein